jgi:radical SAM protein with 4Fe4S-binding SPASM domain
MITALKKDMRRVKTVARREISYFSLQPREMNIELTHRCNLRCKMCGVWGKGVDTYTPELSCEEYDNLFSQIRRLGVKLVTLTGGEAFIRKDVFDIIDAAKRMNLKCNVFTNGTLIDNGFIEGIFQSGIDKIIVSIDGIGEVHDAIRGVPGSFAKSVEAIKKLVQYRQLHNVPKPEIDIHTTLMNQNVHQIEELNLLSHEIGINFSFQPYSESSESDIGQTALGNTNIGSLRYLRNNKSLRFSADSLAAMRGGIARLPVTFYTKMLSSIRDEELMRGQMPVKKCYITRNFMMIDPYGNVFPCTNLDCYIVGNIRENELSDIWHGKKYDTLRKHLAKKLLPICLNCCHCADNLSLYQLILIMAKRK